MVDSSSQYSKTQVKGWYLDVWTPINISADTTDSLVLIDHKYDQRPDLFARDLYTTERLWWIFMRRNMDALIDGWTDFTAGTYIYVPTLQRVRQILSGTGSNNSIIA